MTDSIRIAHYLNQYFGGVGGEEKASIGPQVIEGPVGPGRAIDANLDGQGNVAVTVLCGDNYFAERTEESLAQIIDMIRPFKPDLLIAGPAFNAGRYGIACGEVCQAVEEKLGIPVVTAMYEENPGVDLYAKQVYIVKSSDSVRGMNDAVKRMVNLGQRLLQNEKIGKPHDEGTFPRGFVVDEISELNAAERAIIMVLARIGGQQIQSEIQLPKFESVKPAPAVIDLSSAEIALVTDGGLVQKGNPNEYAPRGATHVGFYEIAGLSRLSPDDFEAHHSGYDTQYVNQDPNRLVPLDVMYDLEQEGVIKKVHPVISATAGVASSLSNAKSIGQRIAESLKSAGVNGVILTSTWGTSTRCGAAIEKEIEKVGIPAVQISTMTPIAVTVGSNRVVPGGGILHPVGNAEISLEEERRYRRKLVEQALVALQTKLTEQKLFSSPV